MLNGLIEIVAISEMTLACLNSTTCNNFSLYTKEQCN